MTKTLPCVVAALCLVAMAPRGHAYEVVARTFPVIERDALEELEERAAKVDWAKHADPEKMRRAIEAYRPEGLRTLPRAMEERERLVDMNYTLPEDIPDGKGGVLYPKGFRFNPLEYVPWNRTVVVINGADDDQVAWFRHSPFADDVDTSLLLTAGGWVDVGQALARPVYYLTANIAQRFALRAVPSIVRRHGDMIQVREVFLPPGLASVTPAASPKEEPHEPPR